MSTSLRWVGLAIDCVDAEPVARFYAQLLGFEMREFRPPEWAQLWDPARGVHLNNIQGRVPGYRPPTWPERPGQQQKMLHLGVEVDDVPAAVATALAAGGTEAPWQPPDRDPNRIRIVLDPAGHPVCLFVTGEQVGPSRRSVGHAQGPGRSARRGLAKHEPMAVGRSQPELTHSPGFVRRRLQYLGAGADGAVMKRLDVIDVQVGHVAVVAQLRCRHNVRAAPEHELDGAGTTEGPVAGVGMTDPATKYVAVPRSRQLEVVNGQNWVGAQDLHRPSVPYAPWRAPPPPGPAP